MRNLINLPGCVVCWLVLVLSSGCITDAEETDGTVVFTGTRGVVINEVSSSGSDSIELFNPTESAVDISGWMLQDESRAAAKTYTIADGNVLAPGDYVVLLKDIHHKFGLGGDDAAYLLDPSGAVVDTADWPKDGADVSWCRLPNGSGDFVSCPVSSFGTTNPALEDFEGDVVPPVWEAASPDDKEMEPDELGFDGAGRVWVGDPPNGRILIYGTDGSFETSISGYIIDDGAHAIRRSPGGQMYVADRGRARVNIYDEMTLQQVGTLESNLFSDPKGIAFTADGSTYVADQSTNAVEVFDPAGVHVTTWPATTETVIDKDKEPCAIPCAAETIVIDEANNRAYVTSANAGRIELYDLTTGTWLGKHIGEASAGSMPAPGRVRDEVEGLGLDLERQLLFAVDEHNGRVLIYSTADETALTNSAQDFAFIGAYGGLGKTPGSFRGADGLDIDVTGEFVAVADQENERVQVHKISTIVDQLGIGAPQ
ncbi:MAG: DNA-binding beta-propeller fold protein YncE [Myxococcota bacterium]|jgi:DNA-binding beta-propeller fold protein YncE